MEILKTVEILLNSKNRQNRFWDVLGRFYESRRPKVKEAPWGGYVIQTPQKIYSEYASPAPPSPSPLNFT